MDRLLLSSRFLLALILTATVAQVAFAGDEGETHIRYIENKGQWDNNILFKAELGLGNLYLEKNRFTYDLQDPHDLQNVFALKFHDPNLPIGLDEKIIHGHAFHMNFVGCNSNVPITSSGQASFYYNYFIGDDQTKWAGRVHLFDQMNYENIYPGIDLTVYSKSDWVKYDFKVKPHSDVSEIQLNYEGVDKIFVKKGKLNIVTSVNTLVEEIPLAYQIIRGDTVAVQCEYKLDGTTVRFVFKSAVDPNYAVIIDPTIVFCTYTGSTADNWGFSATYDKDGDMYSAGITFDPGYPVTVGAYQTFFGGGYPGGGFSYGSDVSITKFDPTGSSLIYSTYLGGSSNELPHSTIVNSNNELIVYGTTSSTNFPTTAGCYDNSFAGGVFYQVDNVIQFMGADIFVTHFNVDGTGLVGSTYLGGSSNDGANIAPYLKYNYGDNARGEVISDGSNNIYIASCSNSSNFPTTTGAYQTTLGGGSDGVVCELNSNLTQLTWSTYIGGSSDDAAYSMKLNSLHEVYVCGGTRSSNFPTTAGAIHTTYQGGFVDGFVAHLNATGTSLLNATYLGTTSYDQAYILSVDPDSHVYVFGQSLGNYPVSSGVYSNANTHQFLHRMDPTLSTTDFSTVIGNGSQLNLSPTALMVDLCHNIYLAGWGGSVNVSNSGNQGIGYTTGLPITGDAFQSTTDGSDFYFMVLYPDATALEYGSYFGENGGVGDHVDGGTSRFDENGVMYEAICASCGGTQGLPTTPGAWSNTNNSSNCNEGSAKFQIQFAGVSIDVQAFPQTYGCVPLQVGFSSSGTNVFGWEWFFNDGSPPDYTSNPIHTYTTPGIYNVMLVGIDSVSCDTTFTDTTYILVIASDPSISAAFTATPTISCDSMIVNINNTTTGASYCIWNFGNGVIDTTAAGANPTAIYYGSGQTYTITLTAIDTVCPGVDSATVSVTFTPLQPPPVADFTYSMALHCDTLTLNFHNNSLGAVGYLWDLGNQTTSTAFEPSVVYTVMDTYYITLVVTDTGFCVTTDTMTQMFVFNNQTNPINAAFIDSPMNNGCDSLTLGFTNTSVGGFGYIWDFGNGVTYNQLNAPPITYNMEGDYTITLVALDTGICAKNDTIVKTIHYFEDSTPAVAQFTFNKFPACDSMLVIFTNTGSGADYYHWDFGNGTTSNLLSPQIAYDTQGVYTITMVAEDTGYCAFNDIMTTTITYIVNTVPMSAAFTDTVISKCPIYQVNLTNASTGTNSYHWDFGDGTTSSLFSPQVQYLLPGTYTITLVAVDTSICQRNDTVSTTVTLLPQLVADFTTPANGCIPYPVTLTNISQNGQSYLWNFGDGNTSSQSNVTETFTAPGTYNITLIVTNVNTCNQADTVTYPFQVFDSPTADFIYTPDVLTTAVPVQFTNQSQGATAYIWQFGDGETSGEINPVHSFPAADTYRICLDASNQYGCSDSLCKITVVNEGVIDVPTAFSPNGDGINDFVFVRGHDIAKLDFRIFNRWGQLVFETHDQAVGWDGYFKASLQEMEVYVWTLDATLNSGKQIFKKGNVTLLR